MSSQTVGATLTPKSSHNDWLDKGEVASLTVSEIVRRVTALQEVFASEAENSEQRRETDDAVWSALRKTGIFYLMVPKDYGGLEGGLQDFIDVILPIAEADTSLAWNGAFSVMHQWLLAQFPKSCRDDLWGRFPYVTSAGSVYSGKAAKVDGGFRASARHKYCSGVMQSEWVHASFTVEDENGEKRLYLGWLPIGEVAVLDTWRMEGMAATGSHDVVYEDCFVPDHMTVLVDKIQEGGVEYQTPAYRIPFASFLALVICVPMLGALRGELKRFPKRLLAPGPDGKIVDKPLARLALAQAEIDARAAELLIRDAARQMEEIAAQAPLSKSDRIRIRALCSRAGSMCLAALRSIADVSSTSAHTLSSPMQRALRDVTVLSSHATLEFSSSMDEYGRNLLGMPSNWWLS